MVVSISTFYILPEDRAWAERRVAELEIEIQAMGPDFYEAFEQSSETWHDNAPFEALREEQALLASELKKLREILRKASPGVPKAAKNTVTMGRSVVLTSDDERRSYRIAGDWTNQAGISVDGSLIISRNTPIATALLGKKCGDAVTLPPRGRHFTIAEIT